MKVKIEKINKYIPELITAFYINAFNMLKPIVEMFGLRWGFVVLVLVPLVMLGVLIRRDFVLHQVLLKKWSIVVGVVTVLALSDVLFRYNNYVFENYYNFILHGAVTGFLLIFVEKYERLLFYWINISVIIGCIYSVDPLLHYVMSGGYMGFASVMLPAFIGAVLLLFVYRVKWTIPLLLFFLTDLTVYGNKGAAISAVLITSLIYIFTPDSSLIKLRRVYVVLGIGLVGLLSLSGIFSLLKNLAQDIGVGSYSLTDFADILDLANLSSFNSRSQIWENVFFELKDNWGFGLGIGGFETRYGNYPHNFFLDIFVTHGVILGGIIVMMIFSLFKKCFRLGYLRKDIHFFSFTFFLLWFIPAQLSFTYWRLDYFWIFIFFSIYNYDLRLRDMGYKCRNAIQLEQKG